MYYLAYAFASVLSREAGLWFYTQKEREVILHAPYPFVRL